MKGPFGKIYMILVAALFTISSSYFCFNETERVNPGDVTFLDDPKTPVYDLDIPLKIPNMAVVPLMGNNTIEVAANAFFKIFASEMLGLQIDYYPTNMDLTLMENPETYYRNWHRWCIEGNLDIFPNLHNYAAKCNPNVDPTCTSEDYSQMVYEIHSSLLFRFAFWTPLETFSDFNFSVQNYQIMFDKEFRMMNPINKTSNKSIIWAGSKAPESFGGINPYFFMEMNLLYFGLNDFWEIQYYDTFKTLADHLISLEPPYIVIDISPGITTSIRDFIHIQFPANPTDDYSNPCVLRGSCEFPPFQIYKALCKQFTEETHSFAHYFAKQLYDLFSFDRNKLNHMMKLYTTKGATIEESVCAWMKSPEGRSVWEPWRTKITSPHRPKDEERLQFVYSEDVDCIGLILFCIFLPILLISICCFASWKSVSEIKVQKEDINGCEGCMYILFNQDRIKTELFFPKNDSEDNGKFINYLSSLNFTETLSILSGLADMGSDIMFSKSSWDIFQCVGMLSVASTCMGALAFALCWNVDYLIWKHGIKRENKLVDKTKQRKIQRLRWTIILISPIENAVQITLGAYMFHAGEKLFWAYLSVIMSILTILGRFAYVIITLNSPKEQEKSSFLAPPEKNLELALTPLTSISDTATTTNHSVGGSELVTQSNSSSCTSPKLHKMWGDDSLRADSPPNISVHF